LYVFERCEVRPQTPINVSSFKYIRTVFWSGYNIYSYIHAIDLAWW